MEFNFSRCPYLHIKLFIIQSNNSGNYEFIGVLFINFLAITMNRYWFIQNGNKKIAMPINKSLDNTFSIIEFHSLVQLS